MAWADQQIEWRADGAAVRIGLTRFGSGPGLLLLPALSSISTRAELRPLQSLLGRAFSTLAVDWPGFGELPRPKVDWRPELYRAFLRFLLAEVAGPGALVAAGHAAGYALAQAAEEPASVTRLVLLSPTWRGPLPTMAGKRLGLFAGLVRAVDLPLAGRALYRLNVNGPVIRRMARGHVYADPAWLTAERLAAKRAVTAAPGARHASFRFVAGALDPFPDRQAFLAAARRVEGALLLLYGAEAPPKSRAEMAALGALEGVSSVVLPRGKLSFYEEFPEATAAAILGGLEGDSQGRIQAS